MQAQLITIDADTGVVTLPARPLRAILGTLLQVQASFVSADEATTLPEATTGRLVAKASGDFDGVVVLQDSSWSYDAETGYTAATLADSVQLRALLRQNRCQGEVTLRANLEWQLPDEDQPRKSLPFDIRVFDSPSRSDDQAPDVAGQAASDWLDARTVRKDKALALTAGQRTQVLTNIGNLLQMRISDDNRQLHFYNPAGIYQFSVEGIATGQPNL